jgi:3',5'-cyclic AMP phosphodiesterase CpdA
MVAGWAFSCWPGGFPLAGESAATPNLFIACLGDAHLRDGNDQRPEALSLARAVAEIRALNPAPDLVLFAGDLGHAGNPGALALGREILSDLPGQLLAVRGEGDGVGEDGGSGAQFLGESPFLYSLKGINLLGLNTVCQDTPQGPAFALGENQRRWLATALPRLDPATLLVVLSHAPLTTIFRPWGQWTTDSTPLLNQLSRFHQVLCCHGHVHQPGGIFANGLAAPEKTPLPLVGGGWGEGETYQWPTYSLAQFTPTPALPQRGGGRKKSSYSGMRNLALPATSWPLPVALEGTPWKLRPGSGPRGCGWGIFTSGGQLPEFRHVLWQT